MDPAVSTLAGVVVGAAATGGVEFAMRVRGDRRELRVAARLVRQTMEFYSFVVAANEPAKLMVRRAIFSAAQADRVWSEHRTVLAAHLTPADWDEVEHAARIVASIDLLGPGTKLEGTLEEVRPVIRKAIDVLCPYHEPAARDWIRFKAWRQRVR